METKTSLIPFQGGVIEAVLDAQGKPWVVLRRLCDNLGIDAEGQRQRLSDESRSPWAVTCMIQATASSDGKRYDMFCLDLPTVGLWLATIESSRVREEVRPTLVVYQKECARTLYERFFGPPQRRKRLPVPVDRAGLRALVRELLYEEAPLLRKIVLPLVREEQAQLPAGPELLTAEEAAARLGMSVRTFQRRLAQHQELLALRVGRKWPWPLLRERFPLDGG